MIAMTFILLVACLLAVTNASQELTVQTKYGKVSSNLVYFTDDGQSSTRVFLGIPFATPPVGNLRFETPRPPKAWSDTLQATKYPPMCIQVPDASSFEPFDSPTETLSEDCLYLNIYTPSVIGRRPVFVWLFGGKFIFGSGNYFEGTAFSSLTDTVVVTINYRVGPLGFLYLRDEVAKGNMGLKDQQLALRWVKENIASFGGDPNQVTIGGQSAGSTSVSAQILAPSSAPYFQRAITQSSSIFIRFTVDVEANSRKFASDRGCPQDEPADIVACLRAKNASDLATGFMDAIYTLGPVQDGDFLPADWVGAYNNKQFNKVPLLTGSTSHEAYFLYLIFFSKLAADNKLTYDAVKTNIKFILGTIYSKEAIETFFPRVLDFYFKGKEALLDDANFLIKSVEQICSDFQLTAPAYMANEIHSWSAPVFMYEWQADPRYLPIEGYDFISNHGAELLYMWGTPFVDSDRTTFSSLKRSLTDQDRALSKQAVQYWGNFIKHGNPNGFGLPLWLPATPFDKNYVQFNVDGVHLSKNFRLDRNYFWINEVPKLCGNKCSYPK